jgi:hypothetical protein
MRTLVLASVITVFSFSVYSPAAAPANIFSGTWCVGREGLVITFTGKDSIKVSSLSDESISGRGTYRKKGETLTATLVNEDLELKMGYNYQVKPDSTLRARIIFFTVNGDSVNHPKRWMRMKRCDPEKGIIPKFEDEEGDTL